MKKTKNKFSNWWVIWIGLMGMIGSVFMTNKVDRKLAILGNDGLVLVRLRAAPKLITIEKVKGKNLLWIPGGAGYYEADKIKDWLVGQKKANLIDQIVWFNFGLDIDHLYKSEEGVDGWNKLIGWWDRWQLSKIENDWLWQEQEWKNGDNAEKAVTTFRTDLAGSANSFTEGAKLVEVINRSGQDRLADFIGKRLSWGGYWVVATDTGVIEDGCIWKIGTESKIIRKTADIMECKVEIDEGLGEYKSQLYLGRDWSEMIKYQSVNIQEN